MYGLSAKKKKGHCREVPVTGGSTFLHYHSLGSNRISAGTKFGKSVYQKFLKPLPLHGKADKITEGKSILRTPVSINEMSTSIFLKRLGECNPWGNVRRGTGALNRYYKEFSVGV